MAVRKLIKKMALDNPTWGAVPPKYSYPLILLTKSVGPNTIQSIMITIMISIQAYLQQLL
jgi:hypothetical protein